MQTYHEIQNKIDAIVERDPQGESEAMSDLRKELESAKNPYDVDEFTRAYMEAALWSSHDESTPEGGEPMDANYSIEDIAPKTLGEMIADCQRFQVEQSGWLRAAYENGKDRMGGAYDASNAGHDFWLTRCGHGAGFWDRDLGEAGEKLTEACGWKTTFPNIDLYIGDDGKIHQS